MAHFEGQLYMATDFKDVTHAPIRLVIVNALNLLQCRYYWCIATILYKFSQLSNRICDEWYDVNLAKKMTLWKWKMDQVYFVNIEESPFVLQLSEKPSVFSKAIPLLNIAVGDIFLHCKLYLIWMYYVDTSSSCFCNSFFQWMKWIWEMHLFVKLRRGSVPWH